MGRGVEKPELLCIVGWDGKWYSYYEKWYTGSQKIKGRTTNHTIRVENKASGIYSKMHVH